MEATTTGRVDQLWTKEKCSSHPQHLLGKEKNSWPGLWPPCFLKRLTWVSDETMGLSTHSACHVETVPICQVDSVSIFLMPFCPNVMQGLYQWIILNLYPYLKTKYFMSPCHVRTLFMCHVNLVSLFDSAIFLQGWKIHLQTRLQPHCTITYISEKQHRPF